MSDTPPAIPRERAWALLTTYTTGDSLLKHALAVEASVRGYARRFGEDEEFWGNTALLHDFDYERYPSLEDHPFKGAEILRAEGEKAGQILQAEGRREAAFRDAEAREREAEAEAKATQMVSDAIASGDVAALNYFIADKYIKAFGQIAESPNQKIIMLPIEAVGVLGSLAGIGEIAKATFGESAASATAAARRSSVPPAGPTPPRTT